MIIEDKVRFWAKEGAPFSTGGRSEDNEAEDEEIILLKLTKKTFNDGTFIEAVMFRLYYEAFIEFEEWDEIEKKVKELAEKELETIGL